MYYDVVYSEYDVCEGNVFFRLRIDSHLICGGFDTEDDAMQYINTRDCDDYPINKATDVYGCVEIEEHNEDGSIASVIAVDRR